MRESAKLTLKFIVFLVLQIGLILIACLLGIVGMYGGRIDFTTTVTVTGVGVIVVVPALASLCIAPPALGLASWACLPIDREERDLRRRLSLSLAMNISCLAWLVSHAREQVQGLAVTYAIVFGAVVASALTVAFMVYAWLRVRWRAEAFKAAAEAATGVIIIDGKRYLPEPPAPSRQARRRGQNSFR